MAKRYKHVTSGAVVSVRDDKVLGSEWVDLSEAKISEESAPRKRGRVAAKPEGSE